MCIRDRLDTVHDSYKLHITDTLIAGKYKNTLDAVEKLVTEGPSDVPVSYTHLDVYKRQAQRRVYKRVFIVHSKSSFQIILCLSIAIVLSLIHILIRQVITHLRFSSRLWKM